MTRPADVLQRITAHAARAALVDYVAQCTRDAEHAARAEAYERAATYEVVVDDLTNLLRRWDIATDSQPP
jgi:hypothetical protein